MFRTEPVAHLIEQEWRRWAFKYGKRSHILHDARINKMKQQLKVERFEL
jgi:hypothetical protein